MTARVSILPQKCVMELYAIPVPTARRSTLEGRIVATADRIAYVNHDIDDGIRALALFGS